MKMMLSLALTALLAFAPAAFAASSQMKVGVRIAGSTAAVAAPELSLASLVRHPGETPSQALVRAADALDLSAAQLQPRSETMRTHDAHAQGVWERADGMAWLEVVARSASEWGVRTHWQARKI